MNVQSVVAIATDARLLRRSCESLIGISAGLVADGELNDREVQFLSVWLTEHRELASTWPGEVIYKRVTEVLADGVITAAERAYLETTLTELIGGSFTESGSIPSESTALPVDRGAVVRIPEASFCFTGQFLFGTRSACEHAVEQRGGRVGVIGKKLDYLVVGELSSRAWKHSSFGTKIESAMKLKAEGARVVVVTEAQWVQSL